MEIDQKLRSVAGLIIEMSDRGVDGNNDVELEVGTPYLSLASGDSHTESGCGNANDATKV